MGGLISNKSILIFVPHEDDEINLAGNFIMYALENNCNVICCFMTNGDYNNSGMLRIKEAIKSLKILGVAEKNIIFLGYCDQGYNSHDHIYYHADDYNYISKQGCTETYGTTEHIEWCYQKKGEHKKLNHKNVVDDIEEIILEYHADYCVCVDFDAHPDHRALSLLFEEAISNVLHKAAAYQPIILKGLSYTTGFYAVEDFRVYNQLSIAKPDKISETLELDNPGYRWDERLRIPVSQGAQSGLLLNNPIFKALLAHKTQKIAQNALSIINSDSVYWVRLTTSVTYKAKFIASSGNSEFLHDFKLFDSLSILEDHNNLAIYDCGYWIPTLDDEIKSFLTYFQNSISISQIVIYENPSSQNHISLAEIELSNGFCRTIDNINEYGHKTMIDLPIQNDVTWLKFRIVSSYGDKAGIGEFEIYEPYADEIDYIKICIDDNFAYKWYLPVLDFEFEVKAFTKIGSPIFVNKDRYVVNFSAGIKGDEINRFKGKLVKATGTIKVHIDGTNLEDQVKLIALKWPIRIKFLAFRIINTFTILIFRLWYKMQRIIRKIKLKINIQLL